MHCVEVESEEIKREHRIARNEVMANCEALCGKQELNQGLLQEG